MCHDTCYFFEGFPSPLLVCSAVLFLPGLFSFFLRFCLSFSSDLCQTLPVKDKTFCSDLLPAKSKGHKFFTIYFCPIFQKTHVSTIRKMKDSPYGLFNFDFNFSQCGGYAFSCFLSQKFCCLPVRSVPAAALLFWFELLPLHNKLYFFLSDLLQISFSFSGKKFYFLANVQVIFPFVICPAMSPNISATSSV